MIEAFEDIVKVVVFFLACIVVGWIVVHALKWVFG